MSLYDPSIFKAYDLRGTYPDLMNEKVAYAAAQGLVTVLGAKRIAIGRDVRLSGPSLLEAAIRGATDAGAEVIDIGVISSEMLYFAAGTLEVDGGMSITASHNPAQWNGVKMCGKGGYPMSKDTQLGEVYQFIQSNRKVSQFTKGAVTQHDLLPEYAAYLKRYLPADLAQLKVVANPNFGANGKVVDMACDGLPLSIVRLNWQEDGSFPKGAPDPSLEKNRREISETIIAQAADFGVTWDADADRCFFFDNLGRYFHPYYITTLLVRHFLSQNPGATIAREPRLTWAIEEAIQEGGGKMVPCRVGHSFIKQVMRDHDAIFCGEVSGHSYYREFFFCDNGMITFLTILKLFAQEIKAGKKVSELLDDFLTRYPAVQGELNYITPRASEIIEQAAAKWSEGNQEHLDGLSVDCSSWRFNIRSSNTEPLLRVSLEARTTPELKQRQAEVEQFMQAQGATLRAD